MMINVHVLNKGKVRVWKKQEQLAKCRTHIHHNLLDLLSQAVSPSVIQLVEVKGSRGSRIFDNFIAQLENVINVLTGRADLQAFN